MIRLLLIIFFLILSENIRAQVDIQFPRGSIVDVETGDALPYCKIKSVKTDRVYLGGQNGSFHIEGLSNDDTLVFYFTGYKKEYFSLTELIIQDKVKLTPENQYLNTVKVFESNQPYLASLIAETASNNSKKYKKSKVYYALDSYYGNEKIEQLDAFYNATTQGYDFEDLEFKFGKVGLKRFKDRVFVSLQTSLSIAMMNLTAVSNYFPNEPLQYNKRKIQQTFDLKLVNKYALNGDTAMVIRFQPKGNENAYFKGELTLTETKNKLVSIRLSILNAKKHPFVPIFQGDEMMNVELNIYRTFDDQNEGNTVDKTYFDYEFDYVSNINFKDTIHISSNAVLFVFDTNREFFIPLFKFEDNVNDYRKISAFPSNNFFWSEIAPRHIPENFKTRMKFYENEEVFVDDRVFNNEFLYGTKFHESPYLVWSGKRILWKDLQKKNGHSNPNRLTTVSSKYNLEVQLYFNYDETITGEKNYQTAVIFDPFYSYVNIEITPKTLCFINIYFDLYEIHHRAMREEMNKSDKNLIELLSIYRKNKEQLTKRLDKYITEVFHGENQEKMEWWNSLVLQELEIDNIAIFEPYIESN